MKLSAFLLLFFMFYSIAVQSQSRSDLKEIFDDAEFFFNREEYSEALYYYLQLLRHDPDNANFNFKAGSCLLNIKGQGDKAIPFLEKAVKNITPKYKAKSFNERMAPLHALYFLGNAYRINNEIDKALEVYNEFINSPDYFLNYNDRIVTEEIKSCERAKIIRDSPIQIREINLGSNINTKSSDYNAVVSGNEKVIIYITTLKFYEGLFFSRKEKGEWQPSVNINGQVLSDGDMFPTGLSYDGTELYLVKKGDVRNDIYYSRFERGLWTRAVPLGTTINSRFNEDHASVSKDGKTLYFTSNRRGGYGGHDIYMSKKSGNEWGEAVNLGPVVNSPFDEVTPFVTEDGSRLYFSSNGHFNMGGYDIFYSENVDGLWQTPVNVGFPLNTSSDNLFFVPVQKGAAGYISLERDNGLGGEDIYLVEVGALPLEERKEVEKSLRDLDVSSDKLKIKIINEERQDTSFIKVDKSTHRVHFDVPEGVKVVVEEK